TLDIAQQIINVAQPPISNFVSGAALDLQPFVNKCLEKNPESRYQDVQSLLKDLAQVERRIELGIAGKGRDTDEIPEKESISKRPSIAVIRFENLTADPQFAWWRGALQELLTIRLALNARLEVLSGERVCELLAELDRSLDEEIDKETALEISKRADVEICLRGSFTALSGGVSVSAHLLDSAAGRLIASVSAKSERSGLLAALVEELAAAIEEELNVASDNAEPIKGTDEGSGRESSGGISTPSMEDLIGGSGDAVKAFAQGLEALRRGDGEFAKDSFELALEIDPQSVLSLYNLAMIKWTADEGGSRLDEALDHSHRLGERERRLLMLEKAAAEGDPSRLMDSAEEFVLSYPRERAGYLFLGEAHRQHGECERAFIVFQQAVAISPESLFYNAKSGSSPVFENYLENGGFYAAEERARRVSVRSPGRRIAHQMLGTALYYEKRYKEALEAFARAASIKDSTSSDLGPNLWRARVLMVEGEYDAAEEILSSLSQEREVYEKRAVMLDLADIFLERGKLRQWFKMLNQDGGLFVGESLDPS